MFRQTKLGSVGFIARYNNPEESIFVMAEDGYFDTATRYLNPHELIIINAAEGPFLAVVREYDKLGRIRIKVTGLPQEPVSQPVKRGPGRPPKHSLAA